MERARPPPGSFIFGLLETTAVEENGRALASETERIDRGTGLLRAVSRWEIVALSVNDVIGSGVYLILPVAAAQLLGPASIWAILAAGFAVLLLVLCFAEASSLFDRPGGAIVYTRAAFGNFVGFEVGWMTWIARISSIAGLSVFFARAVGYLWPAARGGVGKWATIVLPLLVLTWINDRGVKSGARTAVVLAWGKVLPLVLSARQVFALVAGIFMIVGAPFVARGVRAVVRSERELEYAVAARSLGAGHLRLLLRHLLPATSTVVVVQGILLIPAFIVAEATLSYVGLGFPDPVASWGQMLHEASNVRALVDFPWLLSPAAAIFCVVLALNLLTAEREVDRPSPT